MFKKIKKYFISSIIILFCFLPFLKTSANELLVDQKEMIEARVLSIDKTEQTFIGFENIPRDIQTITAEIISGDNKGEIIHLKNDYINLKIGERFFANHVIYSDNEQEIYEVSEPNRLRSLLFFTILFLLVLFLFGGLQGLRGLISLIGSLALIVYILIPGILNGFSPVLMSLAVSAIIIILGSFITHGFNMTTASAVIGMTLTVGITGVLSSIAVKASRLTGFESEEAIYLSLNTGGSIDMSGILLGGILIGLLGVLYDGAIGQAISVEELLRADPKMSKLNLYKRVGRMGKEHIGALVNTLAIAYVGVSLPLLLLFSMGDGELLKFTINREIFATEIIRTLVGSIGLILTVPITTLVSIFILTKVKKLPHTSHNHNHYH